MKTRFLIAMVAAVMISAVGVANAQQDEQVINISGATLFSAFFNQTASVNDFIHVDSDGYHTYGLGNRDVLFDVSDPIPTVNGTDTFRPQISGRNERWWIYQYRGHGSGNGLAELVNYWDGGAPAYPDSGSYLDLTPGAAGDGEAVVNTQPMGGTYFAPAAAPAVQYFGSNSTGPNDPMVWDSNKVRVDMGIMDVPTTWFVTVDGAGNWNAAPRTSNGPTVGYGNNPLQSLPKFVADGYGTDGYLEKKDGVLGDADSVGNKLKSLTPVQGPTLNTGGAGTDPNYQIFDTKLVAVNIGYVANPGAAIDSTPGDGAADNNIKKSELQHMYAAGRMPSGENLMAISRDSGSGTRNAAMNSIGVDPSWGRGENIGPKEKHKKSNKIGPFYDPSNINSSSRMRDRISEARLAVGYNAFSGKAGPPSLDGRQELLSVMNDFGGGTEYVTPIMMLPNEHPSLSGYSNSSLSWDKTADPASNGGDQVGVYYADDNDNGQWDSGESYAYGYEVNNIVHNTDSNKGWQVVGIETIATVGNPFYEDIDYDGNGTVGTMILDEDGDGVLEAGEQVINAPWEIGNGQGVAMQNEAARDYIRNLVGSIQAYEQFLGSPSDLAFFATPAQYAADNYSLIAQLAAVPDDNNPGGAWITNPDLNDNLHGAEILPVVPINTDDNDGKYGNVPNRTLQADLPAGYTYTDTTGDQFVCLDGTTTLLYGTAMTSGTAEHERNAVAGDFDGDFSRDADDVDDMVVAYYARHNGLAFTELDGDDATDGKVCPEIMGDFNADGRFDEADVRYGADGLFLRSAAKSGWALDRKANFIAVDDQDDLLNDGVDDSDGNFFGTTLKNGTYDEGDSRADIAGKDLNLDGVVDGWDNPLGWGPIGADGTVDCKDIDYVFAQYKNNPYLLEVTGVAAFADGSADWSDIDDATFFDLSADIDGDLDVDKADVDELVIGILETQYGDANLDGAVDVGDLGILAGAWGTTDGAGWCNADFTGDGAVDVGDLGVLAGQWGFGSKAVPEPTTMVLLGLGGLAAITRRRK